MRRRAEAPWAGRRLHFVGIGGAGMSGLALVARELGAEVTGSDHAASSYLERVMGVGIRVALGHEAANVPAGDGVELVYSTAIPADNPERATARARGLRERHRGELLGELSKLRRCVAVAGTHGKTTTASMIVCALRGCGLDPGYVVGGELRDTGSNAGWGTGEWLVVEADESDRSLLELTTEVSVLTNAELDHHAQYGSRLELEQTLRVFLSRAPQAAIWERPELLALRDGPVLAFDVSDPELDAHGSRFSWGGVAVQLSVPGRHNALNAVAALAACHLIGADLPLAAAALADFRGARRRFERLGQTSAGAELYDDYAHHPTEVRATIEAARTLDPRRVIAVFQPHLYSRTAALRHEFGEALALGDVVVVLEIYPARERADDFPGISGRLIAQAAAEAGGGRSVCWLPGFDDAERFLRAELRAGDLCLLLGAGDIDELGRRLVE